LYAFTMDNTYLTLEAGTAYTDPICNLIGNCLNTWIPQETCYKCDGAPSPSVAPSPSATPQLTRCSTFSVSLFSFFMASNQVPNQPSCFPLNEVKKE